MPRRPRSPGRGFGRRGLRRRRCGTRSDGGPAIVTERRPWITGGAPPEFEAGAHRSQAPVAHRRRRLIPRGGPLAFPAPSPAPGPRPVAPTSPVAQPEPIAGPRAGNLMESGRDCPILFTRRVELTVRLSPVEDDDTDEGVTDGPCAKRRFVHARERRRCGEPGVGGYVEPHTGHHVLAGSRGGGPAPARGLSSQANASQLSHAGPDPQRCGTGALLFIGGTRGGTCVDARARGRGRAGSIDRGGPGQGRPLTCPACGPAPGRARRP